MGITIRQLAEISGYSQSTISRVLSGQGKVKKETREEIERLLNEYQYRTNVMDLREAERNRRTILLLAGDLNNGFYTELIRVLCEYARSEGYRILIAYTDDRAEIEEEYVKMAAQEHYAGILFMNVRGGEELSSLLTEKKVPVVFLNRGIMFSGFDTVTSDNYLGGYLITNYLIRKGHRKIGLLAGHTYSQTALDRRRGYEEAMRDAHLPVTESSVFLGDQNYESGYQYGEHLLKEAIDVTAVFCVNDLMAMGFMDALREYGVKVPRDISVVCYDNTFFSMHLGLTAVGSEPEKLAKSAIDVLLRKTAGPGGDGESIVHRPRIIERSSVRVIE
ncbi:MAG: LacI family transcriptional regulator [Lachnospiraceae bacterium]|nr:LacI family transcriptional regulator [Lachnospiraceae bacterium]